MELTRLAVVYVHLLACCVALGLILTNDLKTIKHLLVGDHAAPHDTTHLVSLHSTISYALIALWITGSLIIGIDVASKGVSYFYNPKLQAKVGMVVVLTVNGYLLHSTVMPAMKKAGSLLNMPFNPRMLAIFAGAVSAVSWCYAALLGVGHSLAWKYSLVELLGAYPFLILGGFVSMAALTAWAQDGMVADWLAARRTADQDTIFLPIRTSTGLIGAAVA